MRCSIIIVSWNGLGWLKQFLPALMPALEMNCEIIIADNDSVDDSVQWVKSNCTGVRVLELEENFGYCGGNNRAAKVAQGDLLFFLNNDVQMDPQSLIPLMQAFQDEGIGAVQPKILSYHNPGIFEYAGAAGGYLDPFGYPYCKGRIFDNCEPDKGQYDSEEPIFWASGAALMIRKELFDRCGGFEESFEFHMEEIELCWKVQRLGYKINCVHQSVAFHVGGGSLDEGSPRKLRYNVRNNLSMLVIHLSLTHLLYVYPSRVILDALAILKELASRRPKHGLAILQGHLQFLGRLSSCIQKRKQFGAITSKKDTIIVRNILLPWQFFVLSRHTYVELPDRFTHL